MVDHDESYGRHILEKIVKDKKLENCLDIGCGQGADLSIVSRLQPECKLFGIDYGAGNFARLRENNITPFLVNIENEPLPFKDNSMDFIIANQVLEHAKEIFWINHEIFRTLKVGGYLFFAVPNILSLHNRILMMFGYHPTQYKLISAHVRPFSKKDVFNFYKSIGSDFCEFKGFWGSQFYPFPKYMARLLSRFFPSFSFSIFFLIKKTNKYSDDFIKWPEIAQLETNYFTGSVKIFNV
ncbi:MAG: class I SAM-dependent methyltransferase [Parcubacteria group bacterium]|nr:class I SAM-dependent methyltransferase [Parcubacteria group bacterium]